MSKNRKNMLRSSLVMLLVAAISLSSATFAWFTAGKTAAVTDIEFTAEAASGIQISANTTDWKSTVSASEINTAQSNALTGKLIPVSSAGSVSGDGALQLYQGSMGDDGSLTTTLATMSSLSSGGGYYKFDLYFMNAGSSALDLKLRLTASGTDLASSVEATGTNLNTQLAARVAMVASDAVDKTADLVTRNGTASSTNIWEPNSKVHTATAKNQRHEIGSTDGKPTSTAVASDTSLNYVGIDGAYQFETSNFSEGAAHLVSGYSKFVSTNKYDGTDFTIVNLPANKYVAVTFYIWIEGQDADCMNDISGGSCAVKLNFYAE